MINLFKKCAVLFLGCVGWLSSVQALDLPLNWRLYPTVATVAPPAQVSLQVEGDSLVVDIQVHDPDIAKLRVVRRAPDDFAETDASFQVFVDGAGTGKFAQVFGLTPMGGILDGTLYEGTEIQTGADFQWTAQARLQAEGWQGQMRIPLSQLQLSPGAVPKVHLVYRSMGDKIEFFASGNPRAHGDCVLCAAHPVP